MLRQSNFVVWSAAIGVILVWGMTFANTRALLEDFSALEILVGRFALAWVALWGWEIGSKLRGRDTPAPMKCGWRDEWLFAAMGFCGIFCYQFLENCAIYYTNASNVAIFVSFGPIVTAALARAFTRDRSISAALLAKSEVRQSIATVTRWTSGRTCSRTDGDMAAQMPR